MTLAGKIFTTSMKAIVILVYAFIVYTIIDLIGQQIEFSRAMGGLW